MAAAARSTPPVDVAAQQSALEIEASRLASQWATGHDNQRARVLDHLDAQAQADPRRAMALVAALIDDLAGDDAVAASDLAECLAGLWIAVGPRGWLA